MANLADLELCPPSLVPWALRLADAGPAGCRVRVQGFRAPQPLAPNAAMILWTLWNENGEVVGFDGRLLADVDVYVNMLPDDPIFGDTAPQ